MNPGLSLEIICGWFGLTRQSYYNHRKKLEKTVFEESLILDEIKVIRQDHPRLGGRKLHIKLQTFFKDHQIKMGRDLFFDLLANNGLLIKQRKRRIQTTHSFHWLRKYDNLIQGYVPNGRNQLWVSDITYWRISSEKVVYLTFITDVFSNKIVGYHASESLEAKACVKALNMALSSTSSLELKDCIHHSDRGVQYCSTVYTKKLKSNGLRISMTQDGNPLDNSVAERINGIIKGEYLYEQKIGSIKAARNLLQRVVELYNTDRPHMSLGYQTPNEVHQANKKGDRKWKNYYKFKVKPMK